MECFPEHTLEALGPLAADLALSRPPTLKESKKIQRAYLLLVNHVYVTYVIWLGTFWSPKEKSVTVITQSYDHMTKYVRKCANLKV